MNEGRAYKVASGYALRAFARATERRPARQIGHTLIHSRDLEVRLPPPGQNSIGTGGQNSIGADSGLPVDVVMHPLVDLVGVLAHVGGELLDGGGVGGVDDKGELDSKSPAMPLAPAHSAWGKEGSAFDHGSKLASALVGQAL